MTEVLNTIIQAIKLLEKKNYDAAEFLLRQEVININRKALMGIINSKDVTGNQAVKELLQEFLTYTEEIEKL